MVLILSGSYDPPFTVDGATVVPSWKFSNLAGEVGILLYENYHTQ